MAKGRDTFNKRDLEKARLKKRKEKEQRKEDRKANSGKGKGLGEMFAYVDAFGNIVSTPPDPSLREEINLEEITISIAKKEDRMMDIPRKTGTVTSFNESKGFGFIRDDATRQSIFFHVNDLEAPVKESDKVSYDTQSGPKGLNAINVSPV
jgi:cold shock CspA family protein